MSVKDTTKPLDDAPSIEEKLPPSEAEDFFPYKFKLRRSIRNKDADEVKTLTFREPTAEDVAICGCPVRVLQEPDGNVYYKYQDREFLFLLARLSETPVEFFKKIDTRDLATLEYHLGVFFYSGFNIAGVIPPDIISQYVLDCYRLARFYGQHPDIFLKLPISKLRRDGNWTGRLMEEMAKANARQ